MSLLVLACILHGIAPPLDERRLPDHAELFFLAHDVRGDVRALVLNYHLRILLLLLVVVAVAALRYCLLLLQLELLLPLCFL